MEQMAFSPRERNEAAASALVMSTTNRAFDPLSSDLADLSPILIGWPVCADALGKAIAPIAIAMPPSAGAPNSGKPLCNSGSIAIRLDKEPL